MPNNVLVINGDIVTDIGLEALGTFHRTYKNSITTVVNAFKTNIPFGVLDLDGFVVTRLREKPTLVHPCCGIYMVSKKVIIFCQWAEN